MTNGRELLIAGGFVSIGRWRVENGEAVFAGEAPKERGVYAFIFNGEVVYVGCAQDGLSSRMRSYRRNQLRQESRRPVHAAVAEAIWNAREIEVLAIRGPDDISWNGMPIDVIAGLEEGLIRRLSPIWNRRGVDAMHRNNDLP